MGGGDAEVHDGTTEILLEAAYFQPMGISRSSKRLGLRSSRARASSAASTRTACSRGSPSAAWSCCARWRGAQVAPEPIDEYPVPVTPARDPRARAPRVEAVLGVELDAEDG